LRLHCFWIDFVVRVSFGDCVFDSDVRELSRRGRAVHLAPKAFRLLEVLIERRPKAVSKAEIHERVWPGTYISDVTLASLVARIRSAIGDDAQNQYYLRTVQGFGYAFCGETTRAKDESARGAAEDLVYRISVGEREIALSPGENILGRDQDSVVWIDDTSVSRHHARIVVSGQTATLEDLGSKNGTCVGGRKIDSPVNLRDGDEIQLGLVSLTFRVFSRKGSTKTASKPPQRNPSTR
jgi:DNA-binding winged helix-turn-helix (wHTH) protein